MKNALIIILFDHPWKHTSDYAYQTGERLRKNNLVIGVLWKEQKTLKENFVSHHKFWFWKKQKENYYLIKPFYIIPFRRFRFIEQANIIINIIGVRLLISFLSWRRKSKKTVLWVFNPEHFLIVRLFRSSVFIVYDCVDFHRDEPYAREERVLVKMSNVVFVNSHVLRCTLRTIREDVHLVPLGFDVNRFREKSRRSSTQLPHDQPIIGYIGGISSRLNYHLLLPLVKSCPMYNFVFVGPVQMHEPLREFQKSVRLQIDALLKLPNVFYYPGISHHEIPQIIRQFDIGIIPYDVSKRYNRFCFPMKLLEYFYTGKPVVSTSIEELKRFSEFVKIGNTVREWKKHITSLLSHSWPKSYQKEQRELAIANSWEKKVNRILYYI